MSLVPMAKTIPPLVWRSPAFSCGCAQRRLERVRGIEPPYAAWEAAVLPLNYTRAEIADFQLAICNLQERSRVNPFAPGRCQGQRSFGYGAGELPVFFASARAALLRWLLHVPPRVRPVDGPR